jgi:hypothetical protein
VAQQRHQRGQRHPGVDEAGPEGVAELVGGDVQQGAARTRTAETGRGGGVVERAAEPEGGGAPSSFQEQEVGQAPVAWVWEGALCAPLGHPDIEHLQGGLVQWDHPLGAELAEGDA